MRWREQDFNHTRSDALEPAQFEIADLASTLRPLETASSEVERRAKDAVSESPRAVPATTRIDDLSLQRTANRSRPSIGLSPNAVVVAFEHAEGADRIVLNHAFASPIATAFVQAGRPIPNFGAAQSDHFKNEVPVTDEMTAAEIASAYEWETGTVIVERLNGIVPVGCPSVLVSRHAPFTWGPNVANAVETAVAIECMAHMAPMSLQLAPDVKQIEIELSDKRFKRRHGSNADYGQAKEG